MCFLKEKLLKFFSLRPLFVLYFIKISTALTLRPLRFKIKTELTYLYFVTYIMVIVVISFKSYI